MGKIKSYILKTHLFNLVTAQLHYANRRKELGAMCADILEKYRSEPAEQPCGQVSDYIWVCWWQGEADMSPLVRECYHRIRAYNPGKRVVLITEENLADWVTFPDYILEKYHKGAITKTHFSDLLRMELLKDYGGVWMDITLLTWSGIPESFYDYPVFTGRYPRNPRDYNVSQNRWTSFFWVSRYPGNILFRYMSDFWREYWKERDALVEYFLMDYALDLGYCRIPQIKEELGRVPVNGCGQDVWQLLRALPAPWEDARMAKIREENWMQKLSYRGETNIQEKSPDPERSIYRKLFLTRQDG